MRRPGFLTTVLVALCTAACGQGTCPTSPDVLVTVQGDAETMAPARRLEIGVIADDNERELQSLPVTGTLAPGRTFLLHPITEPKGDSYALKVDLRALLDDGTPIATGQFQGSFPINGCNQISMQLVAAP